MQITPHFSFEEMTKTDTGLHNEPPLAVAGNLVALCENVMEPIRALLGEPLVIHSGFRSPGVNKAVGGDPKSAHMEGRACDFHPLHTNIRLAFEEILESPIPFDKLIFEEHGRKFWLHVQVARAGVQPRRKAYIAQVTDTGTAYREIQ